jgi:nicotinamidase-related amidase
VRDVLLLIDVLSAFDHERGEELARDFRRAAPALEAALSGSRDAGIPVVYANDIRDRWDGDGPGMIRRALAGRAGDVVGRVAPREGEALILKPRYSAFDLTPLSLLLEQLGAERLVMAGTATEMCVAQSAIDARELGYKVTVLTDACASVDREMAGTALAYLERVVGVHLEAGALSAHSR